jgi:hypothetical protein
MPGFDGTGPLGQGPMTGRAQGFCVLTNSKEKSGQIAGVIGIQGRPISQKINSYENTKEEVINMSFGDGTGPVGLGPMTGRAAGFCAGYPVPGYMNLATGRTGFYGVGAPVVGPYGVGYGMSYGNRLNLWLRRGFGFGFGRCFGRGRGWGRGRGGGRFGYW